MIIVWKTNALFIYMIFFVCMVSESSSNDLVGIDLFFSVCIYQIFFKTKQHNISYTNYCQDQCNNNQWCSYQVPFSIVRCPDRTWCSALSITCKKKNIWQYNAPVKLITWNIFKCTIQWLTFSDVYFNSLSYGKN